MVRGDPAREVYDLATRRFGGDDRIVIVLDGPELFSERALGALRDLGDALVRLPQVRRVEHLVNAKDFVFDPEAGWVDVGAFIRVIPSEGQALAALRGRALRDPVYPKHLVAPDGSALALDLALIDLSDREWVESGADQAIRSATQAHLLPGQRAYFSGRPHIKAHAYHQMVRDLLRLIPLAVAVAAGVIVAMTGSLRGAFLPLAACLSAALWTAAAMVLCAVPLNLITLVLPSTLIALGGLYGVHVMGRYQVECRTGGSAYEIALRTLRYTTLPVSVAGATTCVGFGALLLANTTATTELGWFAVFGMLCLTVISLSGIPAALALLAPEPPAEGDSSRVRGVLDGLSRLILRAPSAVIAVWAAFAVLAASSAGRVVIDTDYLSFFDRDARVRLDFDAIHHRIGGPTPLYLTFEADTEGAFRKPENLRALEVIGERVAALPAVDNTLSMVETVRKLNRAFENGDPAQERIPDTEDEVSDLVFTIPKNELRRFASSNHRAANIIVRTGEQGSQGIRALVNSIEDRLREEDLVPPSLRSAITGNAVVLNRNADRIARDQFRCVGFASVAILVLILALFRSVPMALLAMIPNWLPVLLFFGLLGAGVAPLSIPTGMIGSLSLGVAIDDSVHFLVSYARGRRGGLSSDAAIATTLRDVGRPIVVTSIMLIAGFLTITLSGFATLREFGALTALTMFFCLATDLLLLPALLARTRV